MGPTQPLILLYAFVVRTETTLPLQSTLCNLSYWQLVTLCRTHFEMIRVSYHDCGQLPGWNKVKTAATKPGGRT